jgi:hypothetical protein
MLVADALTAVVNNFSRYGCDYVATLESIYGK